MYVSSLPETWRVDVDLAGANVKRAKLTLCGWISLGHPAPFFSFART